MKSVSPEIKGVPKLATGFKSLDTIIQDKLNPGSIIELLTLDSYCDSSNLGLCIVCASAISNYLYNQSINIIPSPLTPLKSLRVLYIDTCNYINSGQMIYRMLQQSISSSEKDQHADTVSLLYIQ